MGYEPFLEDNACLSCHRIGMEIDRIFSANGFDTNTYMPPGAASSMVMIIKPSSTAGTRALKPPRAANGSFRMAIAMVALSALITPIPQPPSTARVAVAVVSSVKSAPIR